MNYAYACTIESFQVVLEGLAAVGLPNAPVLTVQECTATYISISDSSHFCGWTTIT